MNQEKPILDGFLKNPGELHAVLVLPLEEQVYWCQAIIRKKIAPGSLPQCNERVKIALEKTGGINRPDLFSRSGFTLLLVDENPWYGHALQRGILDMEKKSLIIYKKALRELEDACVDFGLHLSCPPLDILMAHETFHLLDPVCPDMLAEISAHLYATRILSLTFYAGLLDIIHIWYRKRHQSGSYS